MTVLICIDRQKISKMRKNIIITQERKKGYLKKKYGDLFGLARNSIGIVTKLQILTIDLKINDWGDRRK